MENAAKKKDLKKKKIFNFIDSHSEQTNMYSKLSKADSV